MAQHRSTRMVDDDGDWPVDRGRPLGLRMLALLGALSFVMLGLSVVVPLLHPQEFQPPQPQRRKPVAWVGPL